MCGSARDSCSPVSVRDASRRGLDSLVGSTSLLRRAPQADSISPTLHRQAGTIQGDKSWEFDDMDDGSLSTSLPSSPSLTVDLDVERRLLMPSHPTSQRSSRKCSSASTEVSSRYERDPTPEGLQPLCESLVLCAPNCRTTPSHSWTSKMLWMRHWAMRGTFRVIRLKST